MAPAWLDTREFAQNRPSPEDWRESLATLTRREAAALRPATRHDEEFGSPEFVEQLERQYGVQLHAKPMGRPRKPPQAEAELAASATMSAWRGLESPPKCGGVELHRIFVRLNSRVTLSLGE